MYESFYGFKEKPFSMLPDPGFLFLSKKHRAALTLLEYGLLNHVGFCVISGEPGAGKTTILRALLERAGSDVTVGLITNTHQSFGGLLDWVLSAFDLHRPSLTQVEMHQIFVAFLIEEYAKNRTVLLIVDEAQNMNADVLEELRMLSNVNSEKDQLMQVMLAGQPALREVLRRPELMQFAQRIAVDYHLEALSLEETCGYIQHRLVVAGAQKDVFTPAACERIHTYSGGTPRLINLLCETVLVYGFADQSELIDVDLVDEMVQQRMKHSVVPLVNRDIGEQDNDKESSKQMLRDFPWIRPEGGSRGLKPAADAESEPVAAVQNDVEQRQAEVAEREMPEPAVPNHGFYARGRQAEPDAGQGAPVKTRPVKIEIKSEDSAAAKQVAAKAPETSRAGKKKAETANNLIKYALITIVVLLLVIIAALVSSDDSENSSEQVNEQILQLQQQQLQQQQLQQQEAARIEQLQTEAEALKKQRDAALEKIQQEKLAKQEAEKIAAEKAALVIKAAEQQRKRDEQKKIAQAEASVEAAKQAEARARAEAERAKLEVIRLEEQRQMQARLQEEIRQQQELEARRMELQEQRLAEEQEKSRAQLVVEPAAEQDSKKNLFECSGPTARFKSICR